MPSNILVPAMFVFLSIGLCAQAPTGRALGRVPPATLAELTRVSPWPHIGSPPVGAGATSKADEWRQESRILAEALETIEQSWTGRAVETSSDLRIRVGQYEDFLKTVTASGGYGNLVLADCLRRLSLTLLTDYLLTYPAEHGVVAEILAMDRVRLLDSPAFRDMLSDELRLQPPVGGWHLSEKRGDLELVLLAGGSTYRDEIGRMLLGRPTVSKLTARRDVNGLLIRMIEDESAERVTLAGFAEFLGQGGRFEDIRLDDVRPFLQVMERERRRFQFPLLGINMLRVEHLDLMLRSFQSRGGKSVSFAATVEQ